MAIIRTFELDTSNITVNKTIRQLRVTGDIGCEFILQAVQKSTSSGTLDKFYNFSTNTFELDFNKNHSLDVELRSQVFNKSFILPAGTVGGYKILLLTKPNSDTEVSSDIPNSSASSISRSIDQTANTTVTFVFKTSNTSFYSADPPSANITSTNTPGTISGTTTVDIAKTLTNASSDSHGLGLRMTAEFSDTDDFFIEKTQTVDGAISSATEVVLDSLDGLVTGAVITGVSSGSLSGTPKINSIDTNNNKITLSSAQSFADGITLTFKITGVASINSSTGLSFTSNLSQITKNIIADTDALNEDGLALSVTKTARTDGAVGTTINLNGTYGIAGGNHVVLKGFNILAGGVKVSSVSASETAGSITTDTTLSGGVPQGGSYTFIGSSQTIALTGAKIFITSYPTANTTVNIDLDKIITPGSDS